MKKILLFCIFILMGACATPPKVWIHQDVTDQQFGKDKADCRFESVKAVNQRDTSFRSSLGHETVMKFEECHEDVMKVS